MDSDIAEYWCLQPLQWDVWHYEYVHPEWLSIFFGLCNVTTKFADLEGNQKLHVQYMNKKYELNCYRCERQQGGNDSALEQGARHMS